MRKFCTLSFLNCVLYVAGAVAQTVTGSGTTNTVPVFTGSSALGNSPITVSGGNVGIGTTPYYLFELYGPSAFPAQTGQMQVADSASYMRLNIGVGVDSSSNKVAWLQSTETTVSNDRNFALQPYGGNVGIGTTSPQALFHVFTPSAAGIQWTGMLQNPSNCASGGNGVGLQFKTSSFANNYESTKWTGIAGIGDNGQPCNDFMGLAFYTHNGPGVAPNETMRINSAGNVGIGTISPNAKLEVAGNIKLTSGSGASMVFADGTTQTTAWTGTVCGGDYAEAMNVAGGKAQYEPGDVLALNADNTSDVQKAAEPYSTMVAGIYATKPGVVGQRESIAKSNSSIPMAMVGVVPTKVSAENGPIHRGDLLVSSSTPGYAMKGADRSRMLGAVIGKAMGTLDTGIGVIEVLVTLQ